ncbi:MAG: N-acetylgalactosamine-6-sulfatase, partial [Bacteroidales bacterium]|nr:N-acetylgalactosamine-6-sulfatase [Bacteroidales bacterium]
GIRVPMIAAWPGRIKPGSKSDLLSCFYDVLPTLCEVAGLEEPTGTDGISFLRALTGKPEQQEHEYLFWDFPEYGGQQAVRLGAWKGIRENIQKGNTSIQLFNLTDDIMEQKNVAAQYPEVINQIRRIMEKEHRKSEFKLFQLKSIDND